MENIKKNIAMKQQQNKHVTKDETIEYDMLLQFTYRVIEDIHIGCL